MPLKKTLGKTVRKVFQKAGFKVERYCQGTTPGLQLTKSIMSNSIDLVVDVGAASGGYGCALRSHGYNGKILSFEPLASAHESLSRNTAKDCCWEVAPRMALGENDSVAVINVAGNSDSSSLLDMMDAHRSAAPRSAYIDRQEVDVKRLDGLEHPLLKEAGSIFLKIDTQGFEGPVLRGATGLLPRIMGIQVEMSLVPLYAGQSGWRELMEQIENLGFELWNIFPGFMDTRRGKLLQFDGLFFRK